jgi:predicted lactoylglutathione lyase
MPTQSRMVFLNLPVRDLDKSVAYFTQLGFTFNPQFTDENATAMVVSEQAIVMLLVEPFFKTFTGKEIADPATHTEAIVGLSAESREEVDALCDRAIELGGSVAGEPQDHGFMYGRSFHDLDGHLWEFIWMDPAAAQG